MYRLAPFVFRFNDLLLRTVSKARPFCVFRWTVQFFFEGQCYSNVPTFPLRKCDKNGKEEFLFVAFLTWLTGQRRLLYCFLFQMELSFEKFLLWSFSPGDIISSKESFHQFVWLSQFSFSAQKDEKIKIIDTNYKGVDEF